MNGPNHLAVVARELRALDPIALAALVTDAVERRDEALAALDGIDRACDPEVVHAAIDRARQALAR